MVNMVFSTKGIYFLLAGVMVLLSITFAAFSQEPTIRSSPLDIVKTCEIGEYAKITEEGLVCIPTLDTAIPVCDVSLGIGCCGRQEFLKITPEGLECFPLSDTTSTCGEDDPSCLTCTECCGQGVFAIITEEGLTCGGVPYWRLLAQAVRENTQFTYNLRDKVTGTLPITILLLDITSSTPGAPDPDWLTFSNDTFTGTAPAVDHTTVYRVSLRATNPIGSKDATLSIKVLEEEGYTPCTSSEECRREGIQAACNTSFGVCTDIYTVDCETGCDSWEPSPGGYCREETITQTRVCPRLNPERLERCGGWEHYNREVPGFNRCNECETDSDCCSLNCRPAADGVKFCVSLLPGETCQHNKQCASGSCADTICGPLPEDAPDCAADNTCEGLDPGESCVTNNQCASETCTQGLCKDAFACRDACNDDQDCLDPTKPYCDEVLNRCVDRINCTIGRRCSEPNTCCNPYSRSCVAPTDPGCPATPCEERADCPENEHCFSDAVCRPCIWTDWSCTEERTARVRGCPDYSSPQGVYLTSETEHCSPDTEECQERGEDARCTIIKCAAESDRTWTTNNRTCRANLPLTPVGRISYISDTTQPETGSASFTCNADGTWTERNGATCHRQCAETDRDWTSGSVSCLGTVRTINHNAAYTATDRTLPDIGRATFRCTDGVLGEPTNVSCNTCADCCSSWTSTATQCVGTPFTQERTCTGICSTASCSTRQQGTGTAPVQHGGWSAIRSDGPWSSCSASCGGGTRTRNWTRSCSNPAPQCGGAPCTGPTAGTDTGGCNFSPCSLGECIDPTCTEWGSWTPSASTQCSGISFTQTSSCLRASCGSASDIPQSTQTVTGTKDCGVTNPCASAQCLSWGSWTPSPSTQCGSFYQSQSCTSVSPSGCSVSNTTRSATGTRNCSPTDPCASAQCLSWGSWTPSPSTQCGSFSQSQSCTSVSPSGCSVSNTTRSATGTNCSPIDPCASAQCLSWGSWTPSPSTQCGSFYQSQSCTSVFPSGCSVSNTTRSATGTRNCSPTDPCASAQCLSWGSWTPSPSTQCGSFSQSQSCISVFPSGCSVSNTTRSAIGTKRTCPQPPARCASSGWGSWGPSVSTVCSGLSFTQTRSCVTAASGSASDVPAQTRQKTGTKDCSTRVVPVYSCDEWSECSVNHRGHKSKQRTCVCTSGYCRDGAGNLADSWTDHTNCSQGGDDERDENLDYGEWVTGEWACDDPFIACGTSELIKVENRYCFRSFSCVGGTHCDPQTKPIANTHVTKKCTDSDGYPAVDACISDSDCGSTEACATLTGTCYELACTFGNNACNGDNVEKDCTTSYGTVLRTEVVSTCNKGCRNGRCVGYNPNNVQCTSHSGCGSNEYCSSGGICQSCTSSSTCTTEGRHKYAVTTCGDRTNEELCAGGCQNGSCKSVTSSDADNYGCNGDDSKCPDGQVCYPDSACRSRCEDDSLIDLLSLLAGGDGCNDDDGSSSTTPTPNSYTPTPNSYSSSSCGSWSGNYCANDGVRIRKWRQCGSSKEYATVQTCSNGCSGCGNSCCSSSTSPNSYTPTPNSYTPTPNSYSSGRGCRNGKAGNGCSASATSHGSTGGYCRTGYTGNCSYRCNNGSWEKISSSCTSTTPTPNSYTPTPNSYSSSSCGSWSGNYCANDGVRIRKWRQCGSSKEYATVQTCSNGCSGCGNSCCSSSTSPNSYTPTPNSYTPTPNSYSSGRGCRNGKAGNGCSASATSHGSTGGYCRTGYTGNCSYRCNNGSWEKISSSCTSTTPTPNSYTPTPNSYTRTPNSYTRTPNSYTRTPNSYTRTPNSYTPTPNSYTPTPNSYTRTPNSYTPTPNSYTPTPNSYTRTPNSYTRTPNSYTRTPNSYTRTPNSYTPTPNSYTPTPNSYTRTPNSYTPTPNSYTPTPNSYTPTPNSYTPTPNSYTPTPNSYTPTPNSYTPTPNSYTPTPNSYTPTPNSYSGGRSCPGRNQSCRSGKCCWRCGFLWSRWCCNNRRCG